jgi:hypothetical protein
MDAVSPPTSHGQLWYGSESAVSVVRKALPPPPTTTVERILLMALIAALPIEDHIPTVGGFSILFILFGVLAAYVFANRARTLNRIWLHPVFRAVYVLLLLCFLIEYGHGNAEYRQLLQFGFMFAGGVFVAVLCRDRSALRTALYGYIIGSVWLSVVILSATYGILSGATATSYREASAARAAATEDIGLEGNLNALAFLAVQGGVVALAMTLTARSAMRRGMMLGITAFCLLAAFLTMSRGGIGIAALCCSAIIFRYRASRLRSMAMAAALGILLMSLIPNVVFTRFTYSTEDGRARSYNAVFETVSEYVLFGVGSGNFWNSWAVRHGFITGGGKAMGAHNTFLQITINWGLPALLALLVLIWFVHRCIPKGCGNDALALCLPGIALSLFLIMFFSHNFYDKWYSLGLGLLVGANHWIWPNGTIQSGQPRSHHSHVPTFNS